jgi:hypothetical protein
MFLNVDPSLDVEAEAIKLGKFLLELGAGEGDFVVSELSDRDAAFDKEQGEQTWWDETNATLPNFRQAFTWARALTVAVGKPIIWWRIPVGNMYQNNTANHYQDNRVDYLFAHLDEVIAANGAAIVFGAGDDDQTKPETDGGNLAAKTRATFLAPPWPCPLDGH